MSYAFHDIKHIVQPYLDDLPVHSMRHQYHPTHLRAIFLRCCYYRIHLNPHKLCFLCGIRTTSWFYRVYTWDLGRPLEG
jgi:hypothetical protein